MRPRTIKGSFRITDGESSQTISRDDLSIKVPADKEKDDLTPGHSRVRDLEITITEKAPSRERPQSEPELPPHLR